MFYGTNLGITIEIATLGLLNSLCGAAPIECNIDAELTLTLKVYFNQRTLHNGNGNGLRRYYSNSNTQLICETVMLEFTEQSPQHQ